MAKPGLQPTKRPTLSIIAQRAEVSVSTASLVLAGKAKERRISEEVVARVHEIARALDYSPNLLVRSMQQGRTHIMTFFNGFRHTRALNDQYMDRLSTAIERSGGSLGYDILVYCDFRRSVTETYQYLNGGRGDGLLLFAVRPADPLLSYLRASRLPVVLINSVDEEGCLSSVREDMQDGMRQVAQKLIALGHRRIAALANVPGGNPDADYRIALLREFLRESGVTVPDRWILSTDDLQPDDAGTALRFLMAEADPPTVIFCWHDRLGYQILEQCETLGISVPGQLSIVGYDGLRWPAQSRHILASVAIDLESLAEHAVILLDRLIDRKEVAPIQKLVPVTLGLGTTLAPVGEASP
jgi:DNA-binding LacI/PurR family transcriptional regulator